MDRLRLCLETLRRLAKETEDPNCVVLAEREIHDYLQNEIDARRSSPPKYPMMCSISLLLWEHSMSYPRR
jgi:hypothetical protein